MIAPHLRHAAAALVLLAAPPAAPQPLPDPSAEAAAEAPPEAPIGPEAPESPPEDPPLPADLSGPARRATAPTLPDIPLAPDMTRLLIGGWRIAGRAGRGEADHGVRMAVEAIGRHLAENTTGRVTLLAQVAGPADDPSVARRTSLSRAIALRAALGQGGLPGTRVDIRPLGRTAEGRDALDIVAPPAPRAKEPAAQPEPPPAPPPPAPAAAPAQPRRPAPATPPARREAAPR